MEGRTWTDAHGRTDTNMDMDGWTRTRGHGWADTDEDAGRTRMDGWARTDRWTDKDTNRRTATDTDGGTVTH